MHIFTCTTIYWGGEELLHWGPWKMLRKALDTGIFLRRGHFTTQCNLESGGEGGGAHIPGTLKDEGRALETGHLSARDSMKATLREGFFIWDPQRYVNPYPANVENMVSS